MYSPVYLRLAVVAVVCLFTLNASAQALPLEAAAEAAQYGLYASITPPDMSLESLPVQQDEAPVHRRRHRCHRKHSHQDAY